MAHAEPVCRKITEEVKDMNELEANFWLCYGNTTREVFKHEQSGGELHPYLPPHMGPNHNDLCERMKEQESPFGIDRSTFRKLEKEYKNQLRWSFKKPEGSNCRDPPGGNSTVKYVSPFCRLDPTYLWLGRWY